MTGLDRRVATGVIAVTAVALLARFAFLGSRVAHWDEARVGYWILRYAKTGQYSYHPIIHGPFLFAVNRLVFDTFGASDFTARAVVALVGGLVPLTAWLLRDRLRPVETVLLALALAANPLLLYYSRFMRNDVLVGAFAFAAFAFFVRTYDSGRRRHLYAGALALALAFTTKGNALIYVACWVGGSILLLDWVLLAAVARDRDPLSVLSHRLLAIVRGLWSWAADLVGATIVFFVVIVSFFSPRPAFWHALTHPVNLLGIAVTATVGAATKFATTWVGGHSHSYIHYLAGDLHTLAAGAAAVCVLGVGGFVYDRYTGESPRLLVSLAGYWAAASLVIYPAVSDISAPWAMVHVVIPLTIPAAVGAGLLVSVLADTYRKNDRVNTAIAVVLVVALAGWVAYAGVTTSFLHPQAKGPLVQYGQPNGHMKPTLTEVNAAVQANQNASGPDILYYGSHFYTSSRPSPAPNKSFSEPKHFLWRLPLPWYFEQMGARTTSADTPSALNTTHAPVVITTAGDYATVASHLHGYHEATYDLTLKGTPTVFFVQNGTTNTSERAVGTASGSHQHSDSAGVQNTARPSQLLVVPVLELKRLTFASYRM